MQSLRIRALVPVLFGLISTVASAQMSTASAPQYSDADKKKIAEIEQRPEIKDEIETTWHAQRVKDLDYAYNFNSSAHFVDPSAPELAAFRQNYGVLYNNPMLQRYLNAIGQRLVPKDSPNIYSFKIEYYPLPKAEALSTGTVIVSTGLISMLDNEAQLAYVLAHEIAHVEKNHRYEIVRMSVIEPALNKEKQESAEKKRALFTAVVSAAGAGVGGLAKGVGGALTGAMIGLAGGLVTSPILFRDHTTVTEWADLYENEADEAAIGYILDQSYDVREAPKLYARLLHEEKADPRIGLGFFANEARLKARDARIEELLSGTLKTTIDAKLKAGGLKGSSGEFNLIMATLKRDNGIHAIDYDLFAMARDNLEEAVSLRSNDPRAQHYLGKIISLTARSDQDRQEAEQHFLKAIQYDETRGAYPDPHLEHALHLIGENGDKDEIRKELESYTALYQRQHSGSVPPNMPILYDYLTLVGEANWYAVPAAVVSTKNVEPIRTSASGSNAALTAQEVIAIATGATPPAPVSDPTTQVIQSAQPETKPHPAAVKRTAAPSPK
jgi:predicted Zn-dependent protease